MHRLIDADALKSVMIETLEKIKANPKMDNQEAHVIAAFHTVGLMIDDAPTVDAVEVVRCGGCKWWKCADDTEIIKYGDCTHPYSAVRKNCLPNETWFCADGERKEQNDG